MEETNKTQTVILTIDITRDEIKNLLLKRRPGLGAASLKAYVSSLYNINRVGKKIDKQKYDLNLDNTEEVIQIINSIQRRSVTALYSALDAITGIKLYRDLQNAEINKTHLLQVEQIKSHDTASNWIDFKIIKEIYDEVTDDKWKIVEKFYNNKMPEKLKTKKFEELKRFIAFICCSGVFIPPRRNLDWIKMLWEKPENEEESKNYNYIDFETNQFIFNVYKTKHYYGTQKVEIPKQLVFWLKHYKTIKKNNIFLPTKIYYEHFTSDAFSKHIQNFFSIDLSENHEAYNKKISTKLFRQFYLSHLYKDVPKLKDMTKIAHDMGHSVKTAFEYYVKHTGLDELLPKTKQEQEQDPDNLD